MADESEKRIWQGFTLGLGLIIPIAAAVLVGEAGWHYTSKFLTAIAASEHSSEYEDWNKDYTKEVTIDAYHDSKLGNQVVVVGTLTNKSQKELSSIHLEAEFFDAKGTFVYKTSSYISKKLKPSQQENFQISCDCGERPFPQYATVELKVVSANMYGDDY